MKNHLTLGFEYRIQITFGFRYFEKMKKKKLTALSEMTDAKLRYSQLYLDAIKNPEIAGTDEEKAHQQSFVFHLTRASEALLIEANERFGLGLKEKHLSIEGLRSAKFDSKKAAREGKKLAKSLGKKGWIEEVRSFSLDKPIKTKKIKNSSEENESALLVGEVNSASQDTLLAKFEEWQAKMRTTINESRASVQNEAEKPSKKGKE